jgi:hypothetical protein
VLGSCQRSSSSSSRRMPAMWSPSPRTDETNRFADRPPLATRAVPRREHPGLSVDPALFRCSASLANAARPGGAGAFRGLNREAAGRGRHDSIRLGLGVAERVSGVPRCFPDDLGAKRNQSKTLCKTNRLQEKPDHGCVLFVQHPPKNGQDARFRSGSFIACARTFGNCDEATEGGIPRSSRFR